MRPGLLWSSFKVAALLYATSTNAACYDPSPAFLPPTYHSADPILLDAFSRVQDSLTSLITSPNYNTTSFSVQVTSTQSTLWSSYHTARERNSTRPGAKEIQGDSAYRIASITKVFTTQALLQLHKAGKLALDDPVITYLPQLTGSLPWKDITLRILASQLSGLPRDCDLKTEWPNAWRFGLPPARHKNHDLPTCYSYSPGPSFRPCNETDLYQAMHYLQPLFAPNFKSSYSNMAFEILGLVISHVSGMSYESYVQTHVLDTVGMKTSSFKPPPDKVAALPKGNAWFWDIDEGVHNPTGGLYATADDLSLYLRYILTHFNALATGVNWLQPASYAEGSESAFGMPWEIFRTTEILQPQGTAGARGRPVTFYTKGGGVPGYLSYIILAPDYGLGFTILVAGGAAEINGLPEEIREKVTVPLIVAVESMVERQMERKYAGRYVFAESADTKEKLNSSLTMTYSQAGGLIIRDLISNGTDVLKQFQQMQPSLRDPRTRAQLVPTLLYADEVKQRGEKWRMVVTPPRKDQAERGVWDAMCTTNVDLNMYDGNPLNEVVMYLGGDDDDSGGRVEEVELSAFRVKLKREEKEREADNYEAEFLIQEL